MSYHVYIMASRSRALYVGSTSELLVRIAKHRGGMFKGQSSMYRTKRLVHFETLAAAQAMVARERQIKGWLRSKKIALIEATNPRWRDLAEDLGFPPLPPT